MTQNIEHKAGLYGSTYKIIDQINTQKHFKSILRVRKRILQAMYSIRRWIW